MHKGLLVLLADMRGAECVLGVAEAPPRLTARQGLLDDPASMDLGGVSRLLLLCMSYSLGWN
jgi:hypothetical protein